MKGGALRLAVLFIAFATFMTVVLRATARRLVRYEVAGESMLPALMPGDYLIADRRARTLAPGDIVLARDPRAASRVLVKRVHALMAEGALDLRGDNPIASTDSRHFGEIPPALVVARVRARYWPLSRVSWL